MTIAALLEEDCELVYPYRRQGLALEDDLIDQLYDMQAIQWRLVARDLGEGLTCRCLSLKSKRPLLVSFCNSRSIFGLLSLLHAHKLSALKWVCCSFFSSPAIQSKRLLARCLH